MPEVLTACDLKTAHLPSALAEQIFKSQLESRLLDLVARILKQDGLTFYTIGSSGHEGNAAVGAVASLDDMAFLHYRSAAFMLQRARKYNDDPDLDSHLLALLASKQCPISQGRHKVFGSKILNVPPQTSTIASHLPKSVGAAFSIALAKDLKIENRLKDNSVILASFGDASLNHSTALGAINSARWICDHKLPVPIVFLCEDNGIGISTPTLPDWIKKTVASLPNLNYLECDGLNFVDVFAKATEAFALARKTRQPVFLHMRTVRLLGHAGSDIESHYHTMAQIEQIESKDPLLYSSKIIIDNQIMSSSQILDYYQVTKERLLNKGRELATLPRLSSAAEIMESIIPPVQLKSFPKLDNSKQVGRYNLSQAINLTLTEAMEAVGNIVVFGEDIGKKGGVYRVTADLQKKFGVRRVFDTLLDEQSILGTAIGLSLNGLLPIPEIQFLAYVHNAIDQIRGEAATTSFFSSGQYTNPMVIRIPGLAYQKGFGGHYHNDNSIAALREIPGVIIACPSKADNAVNLLKKCIYLAAIEQRVVIFIEPIALYFTKDLYQEHDGLWLGEYPEYKDIEVGEPELIASDEKNEYAIITFGNGHYLSTQAAKNLNSQHGINVDIINLLWLAPLDLDKITSKLEGKVKILIVDETRETGSISEAIITGLFEKMPALPKIKRVTAKDSFIPLGTSWQYVLPSVDDIVNAIRGF